MNLKWRKLIWASHLVALVFLWILPMRYFIGPSWIMYYIFPTGLALLAYTFISPKIWKIPPKGASS